MSMEIIECLIIQHAKVYFTHALHCYISTCAYISTGSECVLIYRLAAPNNETKSTYI